MDTPSPASRKTGVVRQPSEVPSFDPSGALPPAMDVNDPNNMVMKGLRRMANGLQTMMGGQNPMAEPEHRRLATPTVGFRG